MSSVDFHTDSPIAPDSNTDDLLDRGKFCSRIAEMVSLPATSPCLVLSLEGPWGYGKTSALNIISGELAKRSADSKPIQVHFNPWMIGSQNALVGEFLLQMASSVGLSSQSDSAGRLSQALLSYAKIFSFAKLVPVIGPYADVAKAVIEAGSEAAKAASELSAMSIEKQKQRVAEAISALRLPIVVFIDDLDRLPPDEVFTMIRLVKAVSDFPRVAYILAFDPAYIESALERSGISGARAYLDKIVQVRAPLPRISKRVSQKS